MIQKHSIIIVYLCLSSNAGVLQVHADGPNNITRNEGEDNIQVDCPFSLTGAPIWRINDSLLDLASIELPLIPTRFGITITLVTRNIDQTRFQCFAPTGNGLHVRASDVGTLTVIKQDNYQPPLIEPPPYIALDYQVFDFNTTHRTVAWKFLNNQTCTPPVTFTIQSLSCDTDSSIGTWTTDTNFYSLPTEAFVNNGDNLLYLSISASNTHAVECARLPTYIQVFPNVSSNELSIAIGNSSCIEVPPVLAHQSLYVVWPGDPDCICPLCNDGNCVLANCQCYSRSSFAPELNTGTSGNNILCWSNLITSKNNSKIHFFAETTVCNGTRLRSGPVFSKRFIGSSKFLIRGPPSPPQITVSSMPGFFSICFSSFSYYQIKQYSINITDFTGDLLFTREYLEPSTKLCSTDHDIRNYPVECTPFNITVKAYNDVGASNISSKQLVLGTSKRDYCACIQEKAEINYTIIKITKNELSLQISCTMRILYSRDIGHVTIEVASLEKQKLIVQRLPLKCNKSSTTLKYSNLYSGTPYRISAVWTTEKNSVCYLGDTSTSFPIDVGLVAGLSVGLPLFLLTCCIVFIIIILWLCSH